MVSSDSSVPLPFLRSSERGDFSIMCFESKC